MSWIGRLFIIIFISEEMDCSFKCDHLPINCDRWPGHTKTVTTEEITEKNPQSMTSNQQVKMHELTDIVNIIIYHVYILHEHLYMKNHLSAWWVLHLLIVDQKHIWMNVSQECLDTLKCNLIQFLQQFITVYEIWIHHYTPKTEQSKWWIGVLQRSQKLPSGRNMIATFCFAGCGVHRPSRKDNIINTDY